MKRRIVGIAGLTIVVLSAVVGTVYALNLPPVVPEGTNWDTYWNRSSVGTCDCKSVFVYDLDTTACRDFSAAEKVTQKTAFETAYAGHCTYRGDATYTYNCHGYVFHGSAKWGGDPANWLGSVKPCYQVDATGPVYRRGGSHSSFAGTDFTYKGKCGREILCDHDNAVYGAHSNRWKQRA